MTELKAFVARKIDDGTCDPVPCVEVYLKSEADKVISEKDKEIQRLENLCESYRIDCDNLAIREANAYKVIERDNKELRLQKYKRCLAMAERCKYRMYDKVNFIYKTPNKEINYVGTIIGMCSAGKNTGEYYLIKVDNAGSFRVDVENILSVIK